MERHSLYSWYYGSRGARRRGTHGFTMVELVVAAFVMVVVLAGSLAVFASSLKAVDTARNSTIAGQVMQTEIEKLRLLSWLDISTKVVKDYTFTVKNSGMTTFICHRKIEADPARASTMMNITITASWNNHDGSSHTRTYVTRYAKNGLSDYYVSQR